MKKHISATALVREFSDVLNSVRYRGDEYTIVRGGKPIASLRRIEAASGEHSLRFLKEMIAELPDLGEDATGFEKALKQLRRFQPHLPKKDAWG